MKPLNFHRWIDEHRDLLKPPVGNAQIWEGDRDFMVTVVGGPNSRTDYHVNQGEEFFYQVEGDIVLRVLQHGKPVDIPIKEGEILLLPPNTPHSPQRPANTVGLVIERRRLPDEKDTFLWVCDNCGTVTPFTDPGLENAIEKLSRRVPMRVEEHEIILHGACADCSD